MAKKTSECAQAESTAPSPLYVQRIDVRNLFGRSDYALGETASGDQPGRIAILYGDNGSGKTTILRTLFHLLSPNDDAGHKTAMVQIPFSHFAVTLSDKTQVCARRDGGRLLGACHIEIIRPRKKAESFPIPVDDENRVRKDGLSDAQREQVALCLQRLAELKLGLYHLADDRTIELAGLASFTTLPDGWTLQEDGNIRISRGGTIHRVHGGIEGRLGQLASLLLRQSIERFSSWAQTQALRGSSAGESSVNTLYSQILKRLSRLSSPKIAGPADAESLSRRIHEIEKRSRELAGYGFMPEFTGSEILTQLGSVKGSPKLDIMAHVLAPYLDSLEKRLDALSDTYRVVDNLVTIVNAFLSHTQVHFDLHDGLTITTNQGDELAPESLSSGERHLLLIFCNTVAALGHPSIFMVDEPEISLNIKWQRSLISSLCKCIENKPIQYIFATHSLEIISRYSDRVWRLVARGQRRK